MQTFCVSVRNNLRCFSRGKMDDRRFGRGETAAARPPFESKKLSKITSSRVPCYDGLCGLVSACPHMHFFVIGVLPTTLSCNFPLVRPAIIRLILHFLLCVHLQVFRNLPRPLRLSSAVPSRPFSRILCHHCILCHFSYHIFVSRFCEDGSYSHVT